MNNANHERLAKWSLFSGLALVSLVGILQTPPLAQRVLPAGVTSPALRRARRELLRMQIRLDHVDAMLDALRSARADGFADLPKAGQPEPAGVRQAITRAADARQRIQENVVELQLMADRLAGPTDDDHEEANDGRRL